MSTRRMPTALVACRVPQDFNKQRADVKQVSALDPKAGTEKRAVKAALDARGRRRAAVQKLRQMSLDANPHQD